MAGQRLTLDYGSKISLPIIPSGNWFTMDRLSSDPANVVVTMNLVEPDFSWRHVFFKKQLENRLIACTLVAKKAWHREKLCISASIKYRMCRGNEICIKLV